jgi:2-isopropylmalate synthase
MLQFPSTHKPRYNDFSIKASSHETIRDAGERAPFSAQQ